MKIFYNILVFIALCVIIVGIVLFFKEDIYSIPLMISGFLLLSIHTLSLINFRKTPLLSGFQSLTILLCVLTAGTYIYGCPYSYWLLLIAIGFQILISIWNLSKRQ